MSARACTLILAIALVALGCTPAVVLPAQPTTLDASSSYGQAVRASLASRLDAAAIRWRQTNPPGPFAGTVEIDVGPDGFVMGARPVQPLGDGAFSFALEALTDVRVPPPPTQARARLVLELHFTLPQEVVVRPASTATARTPPIDPAEAARRETHAMHRAQCDGGDVFQCVNVGYDYQQGLGVAQDYATAAVFYGKACDDKSREGAEGCADLAWLLEMGFGVTKDEVKSFGLYKLACGLGAKLGCNNLGVMYRDGRGGIAKDYTASAKLFKQACDMGDIAGCANLGYMLANAQGVPKDMKRAIQLYEQACDHDNAYGCHNLGYRYQQGDGVPKDTRKAATLYKKACDGGENDACVNLGGLYQYGDGVPTDVDEAVKLYRKACDAKQAHGCQYLGALYNDGALTPRDRAKAVAYYQKGCDLGDKPSCAELGQLKNAP
jgi:TPR repeat protein